MVRRLHGDRSNSSLPDSPLTQAFANLCLRSRAGMPLAWQTRFVHDTATYLYSYYSAAVLRQVSSEGGRGHAVAVRRHDIGIRPSLTLGEAVEGRELALPLALGKVIHDLRKLCADLVTLQSDGYSLGTDLRHGKSENTAIAFMQEGMTAQEAVGQLEHAHGELLAMFCVVQERARFLPKLHKLPDQKSAVDGYLKNLRNWISGNNAWNQQVCRYL
ncbi:hypothetical protein [Streptomyces sp. NPDC016734]|uniref:terpene synthase family protein n=1 Tax=Streptomyces TaxID=1883 RepID=UPI0037974C7B